MQITALARRVLQLVFALSSSGATLTRPRLERRLGVSAIELNDAVTQLARSGLLDAQRLRLTLTGLACAVASGASSKARPRTAKAAAPECAVRAPITLFSRREAPRAVA